MIKFIAWVTDLTEVSDKPAVFTAFNAGFDFAHVDLACTLCGIENPFGIAPLDLKSLALALSTTWYWRETSKGRLPSIVLPDRDFTHNPLDDARFQQHIHLGLAGLLSQQTSHKHL